MKKSFVVHSLDDDKKYTFLALTPYEAIKSMLYYLNLKSRDDKAVICKTESNRHLFFVHCGRTFCVRM